MKLAPILSRCRDLALTACALQHNNFTPTQGTHRLSADCSIIFHCALALWCVQNNRRIYCIVEMEWNIKDKWRIFSSPLGCVEWKIIKEIICLVIAATVFFFLLHACLPISPLSLTWRVKEKCVRQRFCSIYIYDCGIRLRLALRHLSGFSQLYFSSKPHTQKTIWNFSLLASLCVQIAPRVE